MRKSLLFAAMALVFVVASCCNKPSIVWTEGEKDAETGRATHVITVVNAPEGTDWTLWLTSNHIDSREVEGTEGVIELHHGCWYKMTPLAREGKNLVVKYADRPLQRHCWAPEGFVLEKGSRHIPLEVKYEFLPSESIPDFPYNHVKTEVWDMVPSLKHVQPAEGTTTVDALPEPVMVEGQKAGWYKITLDGACRIEAADEDGAYYAKVTLENLIRNAGGHELPDLVIEDWPDFGYRGFMLDISRNFTTRDNILRFIDLLAHYKVNIFHLHFGDDEGWRVEIEKFPELTAYGAHHAFPHRNEAGEYVEEEYLMPSYNGSIDPDDMSSSANGYLTKEDYIEILKYAWERRIKVIPEFDTPGHSRAAIKAMDAYSERVGSDEFRLSDPEDRSEYCSVQYYKDNALNVAMPSTYRFIEVVFDELIAYHKEAGAPLPAIHVGGDEVAKGAWTASPACLKVMEERGWDNVELMKSYYIEKVLDIAEARGVKIAGWQEVVMDLEDHVYERLKKNLYSVNFWHTGHGQEEYPYQYANDGVPTVLSNMTNTYVDFAYTPDKTERGLSWGGFVDERRSFSLLPYDIYRSVRWDDHGRIRDISTLPDGKTPLKARENVIGVQAQLWTETVRCFDHVTSYVFPKVCGVFERAWNASPSWEGTTQADDPAFLQELDRYYSTVVSHEIPYYDEMQIAYRQRKRSAIMTFSQVLDRDRSKYAVNNFAEDDKYTMLQPYETVSVKEPKGRKVKNIIFMIGDGMGLEQISAAWVCNGGKLNLDNFTNVGIQRTYSANKLVTDSAAAGTALATGHKTDNGMISMTPDTVAVKSLAEEAMEKGKRTGAAVTCRVNDATPAVFFSHSASRKNQEDIVEQMAGSGVYFLAGGGTKFWRDREDGKDISEDVKARGYSYVETKEDLMAVESGPVIALMDSYELKPSLDRGDILPASVTKALELLDNRKGFFLMIEGSMIDDGGHDNKAGHTMEEIFDFDRTLGIVLEWAAKDGQTLVIVTADHATGGMTLLSGSIDEKRIRVNYSTTGHNGIALPVFAWGPHSEDFVGIYENTELSDRIRALIR